MQLWHMPCLLKLENTTLLELTLTRLRRRKKIKWSELSNGHQKTMQQSRQTNNSSWKKWEGVGNILIVFHFYQSKFLPFAGNIQVLYFLWKKYSASLIAICVIKSNNNLFHGKMGKWNAYWSKQDVFIK